MMTMIFIIWYLNSICSYASDVYDVYCACGVYDEYDYVVHDATDAYDV